MKVASWEQIKLMLGNMSSKFNGDVASIQAVTEATKGTAEEAHNTATAAKSTSERA